MRMIELLGMMLYSLGVEIDFIISLHSCSLQVKLLMGIGLRLRLDFLQDFHKLLLVRQFIAWVLVWLLKRVTESFKFRANLVVNFQVIPSFYLIWHEHLVSLLNRDWSGAHSCRIVKLALLIYHKPPQVVLHRWVYFRAQTIRLPTYQVCQPNYSVSSGISILENSCLIVAWMPSSSKIAPRHRWKWRPNL